MTMNVSMIGPTLAQQGISTMRNQPTVREEADMGEVFLGSIEQQTASSDEQAFAKTARELAAKIQPSGWLKLGKYDHDVVRKTASWAALCVIKDGVAGPLAPALAEAGYLTMLNSKSCNSKPRSLAGVGFTQAVRDTTQDPLVKAQAQATLQAAASTDSDQAAQITWSFLASQGAGKYSGGNVG